MVAMMDTMSVAGTCKGAVSFASALASIGGEIMRETSSLVGDKVQERTRKGNIERRGLERYRYRYPGTH